MAARRWALVASAVLRACASNSAAAEAPLLLVRPAQAEPTPAQAEPTPPAAEPARRWCWADTEEARGPGGTPAPGAAPSSPIALLQLPGTIESPVSRREMVARLAAP